LLGLCFVRGSTESHQRFGFIELISTLAFTAYDVALIYRPIIRSAYCYTLPCIEAPQHHGSQFGFQLILFHTRLRRL
jgi:hypothetical protein